MSRKPSTDRNGGPFSEEIIKAVWAKARPSPLWPHSKQDVCEKLMEFGSYGKREDMFGWEIDHIKPVAHGGTDDLSNLQALNWKTNLQKGDSLNFKCR